MRRFLIAVIFLLGIVFIIGRYAEVQAIVETLKKGDLKFLFLAFFLIVIWLVNVAATYQVIFRILGIQEYLLRLIILASAANFVNIVAPVVGMSGMAVFIADARKAGHSSGKVTLAGVLFVLFDYVGFLCVLTVGLLVLLRRNDLNPPELIASAGLLALAAGLAYMIYIGTKSVEKLAKILAWMAHQVNRVLRPFIKHNYLSEQRAFEFAHEAGEGLVAMGKSPRNFYIPLLHALLNKSLLLLILFIIFLAFNVPYSPGTIVAGFSIAYLFLIVSPTPAGIGFVEGALTLILSSFYISLGAAAVVAVAYRGFTFWLPLLFGFIAFRFLDRKPPENMTVSY